MRRILAALTLTAALALVAPIAAHAIACEGDECGQSNPTGTVTITKQINPHGDDYGPLGPTAFPLFVGGTPVTSGVPMSMTPGYYHVTETDQPNYTFIGYSGSCGGDASGNVAVTQYGFSTCTIINEYTPPPPPANGTVTIRKTVINSASGTATVENFSFTIDEETSVTLGEPISLTPGTHTVTERSRTEETYYVSYSASCPGGTFTVASEQNVDCDITNSDTAPEAPPAPTGGGGGTPEPPTSIVVVTNVTNDEGGTMSPSDFVAMITVGGSPIFVAGANAPSAMMTVAPGDFSIEPGTKPGYAWSMSGACSGTLASGDTAACSLDYDDTGITEPLPPENPTDSTTNTEPIPPTEVPPTDSGTSTPPVDSAPPTDTTPPPSAPSPPQPRVLGVTDIDSSITISPTTTANIDSATEPTVTPPAENAPSCTWFWGWMGCYWWILLLLIALALIWKAWSKMNEKKQ